MAGFKRQQVEAQDRQCRPKTLDDIASEGLDVIWWCNRCGQTATLSTAALILRLGPAKPVPEIGMEMCCTGCSSRDVATRPAWKRLGPVTRQQTGE